MFKINILEERSQQGVFSCTLFDKKQHHQQQQYYPFKKNCTITSQILQYLQCREKRPPNC